MGISRYRTILGPPGDVDFQTDFLLFVVDDADDECREIRPNKKRQVAKNKSGNIYFCQEVYGFVVVSAMSDFENSNLSMFST